ncbi:hypothetical protein [Nonlabens sp.]
MITIKGNASAFPFILLDRLTRDGSLMETSSGCFVRASSLDLALEDFY